MSPRYVIGDATRPEGAGKRVIVHVANDAQAWGAGFVLAISRRWPGPERVYREACELRLGDVQFLEVENDLFVANMVAQHGFPSAERRCALDYDALAICLGIVAKFAMDNQASVHMPRIGCGIAGGEWDRVAAVIAETLSAPGVAVSVYDLPGQERAS